MIETLHLLGKDIPIEKREDGKYHLAPGDINLDKSDKSRQLFTLTFNLIQTRNAVCMEAVRALDALQCNEMLLEAKLIRAKPWLDFVGTFNEGQKARLSTANSLGAKLTSVTFTADDYVAHLTRN